MANPSARALIDYYSRQYGVQPRISRTIALGEGGLRFGSVGDGGHAFGPFMMNDAGGVLTGRAGNHAAYANSAAGIAEAVQGIAKAVGGATGLEGVRRGIYYYERPADKAASFARAKQNWFKAGGPSVAPPAGSRLDSATDNTKAGVPLDRQAVAKAFFQQAAATLGGYQAPDLFSAIRAAQGPVTLPGPNQAAPRPKYKLPPGTDAATKAVWEAKQELGTPYSWGGGGPGGPSKGFAQGANTVGFDCSSLMQYAFSKVGVKIPRTSQEQFRAGQPVSTKELQPGDALFFHAGQDGPGHVGMYIGNGQFIEAPHTGAKVQVSSLQGRGDLVGARRYT